MNKFHFIMFYLQKSKIKNMRRNILIGLLVIAVFSGCRNTQMTNPEPELIQSNKDEKGTKLTMSFYSGSAHNHPTFSVWVEDAEGNFIETLFVTEYVAKGIYGHADLGDGRWDNKPGEAHRPATLPYWLHKKGRMGNSNEIIPTPENSIPDAISGATPKSDFILKTVATKELPSKFRVMMEINQTWDWNEYWHNDLFPGNDAYRSSCQPALVYAVLVDKNEPGKEFFLNPVGHSHYDGSTGELFTDITTITSAKDIVHKVSAKIEK